MDHDLTALDIELVATRGDRLSLSRVVDRYSDGSERAVLNVAKWNPTVTQMERVVRFDPEDLEAALSELDELHGEADTGLGPPTTP